jgi:hypothetical protein
MNTYFPRTVEPTRIEITAADIAEAANQLRGLIRRVAREAEYLARTGKRPVVRYREPTGDEVLGDLIVTEYLATLPPGAWRVVNPFACPVGIPDEVCFSDYRTWVLRRVATLPMIRAR